MRSDWKTIDAIEAYASAAVNEKFTAPAGALLFPAERSKGLAQLLKIYDEKHPNEMKAKAIRTNPLAFLTEAVASSYGPDPATSQAMVSAAAAASKTLPTRYSLSPPRPGKIWAGGKKLKV